MPAMRRQERATRRIQRKPVSPKEEEQGGTGRWGYSVKYAGKMKKAEDK